MSAIPSKNKAAFLTAWSPLHRTQVPRCPDLAILLYTHIYIYTYGHQHDHLTPCCACARGVTRAVLPTGMRRWKSLATRGRVSITKRWPAYGVFVFLTRYIPDCETGIIPIRTLNSRRLQNFRWRYYLGICGMACEILKLSKVNRHRKVFGVNYWCSGCQYTGHVP